MPERRLRIRRIADPGGQLIHAFAWSRGPAYLAAPGPVGGAGGRRGGAAAGLPGPGPVGGGLVRAGARAAGHPAVAVGPRGRGPRLVAGLRIHRGRDVLALAGDRPGRGPGGGGVRGPAGPVRVVGLGPAAAAADHGPGPGRAGRGAELLAIGRMGAVLAGTGRPVGGARRQPVAATGRAGPGR